MGKTVPKKLFHAKVFVACVQVMRTPCYNLQLNQIEKREDKA